MKEKNKKLLLLIAILVVGVVGLGLSYAFWTLSFAQENSNFVTSDCFHITFVGENDIHIQKAYPMDDEELYDFYQDATPYHFVIENTCDSEATAVINLETIARDNKLADQYIETILYNGEKSYSEIIQNNTESEDVYSRKRAQRPYLSTSGEVNFYDYQLTHNPVNQNKVIADALTAYKLYEFKFNGKGKREFNLLEYMYQGALASDDVMNKTFESKITVTTAYKPTIQANTLAARGCQWASSCTDEARVFQTDYIENTTKIVFQNKMNPPATFEAEFDESALKDGSVKAYVVKNEDNVTYTIYFQTNGNFGMESGANYFNGFSKVSEIECLKYIDTSATTSMAFMFTGMKSLTSLDVSHFDTSKVTDMGYMFFNMSSLTSLDLGGFDTSNVGDMSGMFNGMTNLANLNLSSFDTSKVRTMEYMFCNMRALTTLDLSAFDTGKVGKMNGMFRGMSSITSLNISSFDTSSATIMSGMFSDMTSLTNLDVSSFNTKNVTDMGGMFNNINKLTSLDVSHFDTSNVTNMAAMFMSLSNLTSLDLSSFDTSNVGDMRSMFTGSSALTSLDLSHFNTSKVTDMSGMFTNLTSLTSLNLSNFNTGNVTNMKAMFSGVSSLATLDVSSFNTSKVTDMSGMFYNMSSLKELNLSSFDTQKASLTGGYYRRDGMFADCSNLKTIIYGENFIRRDRSDVGYMFENCPANKPTHESWAGF